MNTVQTPHGRHVLELLTATQMLLILAVALFVGASCGYFASLRGRYRPWAVYVAPIAAGLANLGALSLTLLWSADPGPPAGWTKFLAQLTLLGLGVGFWGLLPSTLAAWLFQRHCRQANPVPMPTPEGRRP